MYGFVEDDNANDYDRVEVPMSLVYKEILLCGEKFQCVKEKVEWMFTHQLPEHLGPEALVYNFGPSTVGSGFRAAAAATSTAATCLFSLSCSSICFLERWYSADCSMSRAAS